MPPGVTSRHPDPPGLSELAGLNPTTVTEDEERRERRWLRRAAGAAVLLAAVGIAWYIARPGVPSYTIGGWLVFPGYMVVLVWLHRRIPVRVQWVGAVFLAVGGVAAYIAWPSADWWYLGGILAVPLAALLAAQFAKSDSELEPWGGGFQDGPWGPPP